MKLTRERLADIKRRIHLAIDTEEDVNALIAHAEATLEEDEVYKLAPAIEEIIEAAKPISSEQATLRDEIAMAALTGLLSASPEIVDRRKSTQAVFAESAYLIADAMLAARKEKQ
jgi:hypothetical protein